MQPSVKSLLNKAFDVDSYVSTFPFVFSAENRPWQFSLSNAELVDELNPKVFAFCAGRVLKWKTAEFGDVRALCLGSVCTDPTQLNKGMASEVITLALKAADNYGLDVCLLFSESRSLYQRLGFVPAGPDLFVKGRSLFWTVSEFAKLRNAKFQYAMSKDLSESQENDSEVQDILKKLWEAETRYAPSGLSLIGFEEFLLCLSIPRQIIFWLVDAEGAVVAVARYEKDCDFRRTLFGVFSEDFEWSVQLVREVLTLRDIDCLLVESYAEKWGQVCPILEGKEVQMMVRTSKPELLQLFQKRVCAVRGIQSC